MGPMGCPETSVSNYQSTLLHISEEQDLIYTAAEAWSHSVVCCCYQAFIWLRL